MSKETIIKNIRLAKKHPKDAMYINGVLIRGYQFQPYELPANTNLEADEVKAWFLIEDAQEVKPAKPKKTKE